MTEQKAHPSHGTLLTYRPDIKICDCTIRDGGLINDHQFDDGFVKAVYDTLVESGVHYMEVGYKGSKKIFSPAKNGPWRFCTEDDLRRAMGEKKGDMKLAVMADVGKTDYHEDIIPKEKSIIDTVRVACYINQIPAAVEIINDAHQKGYEVTSQLMAISVVTEKEISEALEVLSQTPVSAVFLVDSFGALYSEQIRALVKQYLHALSESGKEVGIHAHNNQQLAYANTIEALMLGASRLDTTINGLGRGAGNCPTELLLGFLKNPRFQLRPILGCIEKYFVPLRDKIDWGPSIPYNITGLYNLHPREAIRWRQSDKKDNYLEFYDKMLEEIL